MRILLSAYACEPGKGSEPGVGWNWALEIARLGHDVWVLTRANNRPSIEAVFRPELAHPGRLQFVYYDLPKWARCFKRGQRGVHIYYALWQWGVYRLARKLHDDARFNIVHHLTFGELRFPSYLYRLDARFIVGPVGGGETAPLRLRSSYSLRGQLSDLIRDVANLVTRYNPLVHLMLRAADQILIKNKDSRWLVPTRFHEKIVEQLEIGIESCQKGSMYSVSEPRILFVGRLLAWKGSALALRAFAQFAADVPDATLTIIGRGPEKRRLERLAERLHIAHRINWIEGLPQAKLLQLYHRHLLLLFPSLHDSSGNVILEAMSAGIPVLCLDLGGPNALVSSSCGRVIAARSATIQQVINSLAEEMMNIYRHPDLRLKLSDGALIQAGSMSWSSTVNAVYGSKCCNALEAQPVNVNTLVNPA